MEDTKHSAAQVLPPRAHQTRTAAGCGTRHCCILYTLSIAVRNLTAQSCSKAQLARRARAVQQSPPRRTRVRVKRNRRDATRPHCCECERHRQGTPAPQAERRRKLDRATPSPRAERRRKRCTKTSATATPRAGGRHCRSRVLEPARPPSGRDGHTSNPGWRRSRSSSG